jgi:phosphoribosyl-ATP pyrophosphohydrolase
MAKAAKPTKAKAKPAKLKRPKAKPAKLKPVKAAKAKTGKTKKKALKLRVPLPPNVPVPAQMPKPKVDPIAGSLTPFAVAGADAAILEELWHTIEARRAAGDVEHSHSARLLARGTAKVAQKLGEEAVECVIEATQGNRAATVLESADLLYHLVVLWVDAGIRPAEVWAELARRRGISGIAEKAARPKGLLRAAQTTKLP